MNWQDKLTKQGKTGLRDFLKDIMSQMDHQAGGLFDACLDTLADPTEEEANKLSVFALVAEHFADGAGRLSAMDWGTFLDDYDLGEPEEEEEEEEDEE